MARYAAAIVVIFLGLSGPEDPTPIPAPGLKVIADAASRFTPPSLTAAVRCDAPVSVLGWLSVDLSAHPEKHEFRVIATFGAPLSAERWQGCRVLELDVDGAVTRVETRYTGVPMERGVYDAVNVELTIDDVRRIAGARRVRANLCGDEMELPRAERAALSSFVRRFDEMATYDGPPPPSPPEDLAGDAHDEAPPPPDPPAPA
ncbi:MAG: hypothetical protein JRH11_01280 [Deltaproteobacteria bacterium]|nr:hypothetical protein [Deltaproteobacteria bacterium]